MPPRDDVPLEPWPRDVCAAMIRDQIRGNRNRLSQRPADPAARIALASAGWLSVPDVRAIRRRLLLGREPDIVIADDYELTPAQLDAIRRGLWRSADGRDAA